MILNLLFTSGKMPGAAKLLPLFLTILMFFAHLSNSGAQHRFGVTGSVVDKEGLFLPYVSISLHQTDGKLMKGVLSDSVGVFSILAVPTGKYYLKLSSMGFLEHQTEIFIVKTLGENVALGKIQLQEAAHTLAMVSVTAQKKLMEQYLDQTVMNVENSLLSEGNTALELLQKVPDVKIDGQDQISLKGRAGVTVMLNGKMTYLSAAELGMLLKGTNANSIAKIEIISNPSSKYDATGNAGLINIVFKKSKISGANGSVSMNGGAGRNARYGAGSNLSYRNKNVNLFGAYNYAYRGETEYLDFTRRFYANGQAIGNPDRIAEQQTKTNEPLRTHNFNLGIDLDLDSLTALGFLMNGSIGRYLHDSRTTNLLKAFSGERLNRMVTANNDRQHWENLAYSLNFTHQFLKKGRELGIDADYATNQFTSDLHIGTTAYPIMDGTGNYSVRKGKVPAQTDVYVAKIDFKDQYGERLRMETGFKSALIRSDNNLVYEKLVQNNWVYDDEGSNHFRYKEQIHAGYLSFNHQSSTIGIRAGVRAEYTRTLGRQLTNGTTFKRSYLQLFPNLSLNKSLNEDHRLQLAYGRRIERPDYGDLNPFRVFRDPLLYYEGNPKLKPELTQSTLFTYLFKSAYTLTLNYSRTKDVITWLTGQHDATNTTFQSPQNLSSLTNLGLSLTGQHTYFTWWTANNALNIFKNNYKGTANNGTFDNRRWSYSINSQHAFKTGKGYAFELNAYYNSKSAYGIATESAYYAVSAAVQKNVLKDKGSLKLLVNDIFQSSQYKYRTKYQNIDMDSHTNVDGRRVMLSFSYRFGNQSERKERKSAGDDILNRVKGGQ